MIRAALILTLGLLGAAAWSLDLPETARLNAERVSSSDRYSAPLGSFDGVGVPSLAVDGSVRRQAWRLLGANLTPLQATAPLVAQLQDDGFDIVFECIDNMCGGFDFRFGVEVLPAPAMYVNLRSFHFVTAFKGARAAPEAVVTILASATRDSLYIQTVEVQDSGEFAPVVAPDAPVQRPVLRPERVAAPAASPVVTSDASGSIVLEGLQFETGATRLGGGPFQAIEALAQLLRDQPDVRVVLVGHTDSVGSYESNRRISEARAEAVRQRLIQDHGIDAARTEARGASYLAPRASHLTEEGRTRNRRVEAVLIGGG